jgi:hypothetical protein
METITLRELALRLEKIERPKSKAIADGKLLGLLKAGELKAGFHFRGRTVRWVPIEPDYWRTVSSSRFRSIRREGGRVYKVNISPFANTYIESLTEIKEQKNKDSQIELLDEFKATLSAASRKYEVVVNVEEWERYLRTHSLAEPSGAIGRGGRHPLAAWRKLVPIIPAYLLAYQEKYHQPVNYEQAGKQIHTYAKNKGRIDAASLPSPDTIKDVISEIYALKTTILA